MLKFSTDPDVAEQQMWAIIFYLTAFGYIDGSFDLSEKAFVRVYIRKLVEARALEAMPNADEATRAEVVGKFVSHFHEVFDSINREIKALFSEVVADNEKLEEFVYAKLELKSFEIFKSFDEANQRELLATVEELIAADGVVHPSEAKFRDKVKALLAVKAPPSERPAGNRRSAELTIAEPAEIGPKSDNHPFFTAFEEHYSADPVRLRRQAESDHTLITQTMKKLDEQRSGGTGKLAGVQDVAAFDGQKPFLDGHVYVHPRKEGQRYELTVLGDLHGCYSCLKGALMQCDFFARLEAFRIDPRHNPEPKLILLGDYIDRGHFSYHGVLRTVLQLYLHAPEHVFVLRGNHEYYIEYRGRIYGGVKPAEAIDSLIGRMPDEMFYAYMNLFESLPNVLLFDRLLFVHAGIPRDSTLRQCWQDLSSLNDPEIRFQMLWSDPSAADYIPEELQEQNARFPFGKSQFESFMDRVGATTLIRGHEKIVEGFRSVYPGNDTVLLNLFSAGGRDNNDLPPESSYREVIPMALTIELGSDGVSKVVPWPIDYRHYNNPRRNAFFAKAPELAGKPGSAPP